MEEMWRFVRDKSHQYWLWWAIGHTTGERGLSLDDEGHLYSDRKQRGMVELAVRESMPGEPDAGRKTGMI
jgi:hypothetical protein